MMLLYNMGTWQARVVEVCDYRRRIATFRQNDGMYNSNLHFERWIDWVGTSATLRIQVNCSPAFDLWLDT
jgi:hypothetical protein